MNKKRLSVVMAGAMLASSVAPVLAAEIEANKKYEVSASDLGLLKKGLREFLATKSFHITDKNFAGQSVYYFTKELKNLSANDKYRSVDAKLNGKNVIESLKAGEKLYIWSEGFKTDEKGNNFSTEKTGDASKEGKYTLTRMKSDKSWFDDTRYQNDADWKAAHSVIKAIDIDETNKEMIVHLVNGKDIVYSEDNYIVNLHRPTAGGYEITNIDDNTIPLVDGFVEAPARPGAVTDKDLPNELLAEITITPGGYNLAVEDLYDGLFLTEEGKAFFEKVKEAKSVGRDVEIKGNVNNKHILVGGNAYEGSIPAGIEMKLGKGYFTLKLGAKGKLAAETYTITGKDETNLERIAAWLIKPQARVDKFVGDNRYETAVEIARDYANLTGKTVSKTSKANIVLVNGDSLVDGLAAAPLAASLENKNARLNAPILLTEADALPKATRAYLKEVIANVKVGQLGKVTIHLVGGETVLNKSLERELKALGFSVERYGGENREATSLAVADAMEDIKSVNVNTEKPFIVGAEGEADAMSIASVASELKTPIIVAKKGGISEDALYELRGKTATIIGGKNVVSDAEYKEIAAEAKGVQRIAGSNRQETNAEIIAKYYKDSYVGKAKNVIVAADGKNGTKLVDALSAANMAATKDAPIVLASNKLSKAQINALELNANVAHGLYQVGGLVERSVVKTIAENLGLSNR